MGKLLEKIELSAAEQDELHQLTSKGKHSSRKIRRAHILLKIHQSKEYGMIAEETGVSLATVYNIHHSYVKDKLNALEEKPRPGQPRKVTPEVEAAVTSIACSDAPEGSSRWTVALINEKIVEMGYQVHDESVRLILKKVGLSLG
jgi:putative transposase